MRGNARTQGELRRKEAGNVFGEGSRTPISITLLVKNPKSRNKKARIYYHDIGDYLSRDEKLAKIKSYRSIADTNMKWQKIHPNEHGDWLNQRTSVFDTFIPLAADKKFDGGSDSFFVTHSLGVSTNRDTWVFNFSKRSLERNMVDFISMYEQQRKAFWQQKFSNPDLKAADFVDVDPKKIKWTRGLRNSLQRGVELGFSDEDVVVSAYRPFTKLFYYSTKELTESPGLGRMFFPDDSSENIVIAVSSAGSNTGLGVIATDVMADLHLAGDTQCFPMYYYQEQQVSANSLFDYLEGKVFVRRDGISDFILRRAQKQYGRRVSKEDIFYYVYGMLHDKQYQENFANDLQKMLPRIPLVEDVRDFWAFSKAGRKLADLHINYEDVPPYDGVTVQGADKQHYKVERMRYAKTKREVKGKMRTVDDKSTIHYNSSITISSIPQKAYEYVINGRSAIDWIVERYRVTTDKRSGITNDPNNWAEEVGNPRYILDLLLSVINVSVQTVEIVESLPKLEFGEMELAEKG